MTVLLHYPIQGESASAIADSIEAGVREGRLGPGAQLPTVRALAARLQLSPTTVAAAYVALRRRGVVAGHGRSGTRVSLRTPVTWGGI